MRAGVFHFAFAFVHSPATFSRHSNSPRDLVISLILLRHRAVANYTFRVDGLASVALARALARRVQPSLALAPRLGE